MPIRMHVKQCPAVIIHTYNEHSWMRCSGARLSLSLNQNKMFADLGTSDLQSLIGRISSPHTHTHKKLSHSLAISIIILIPMFCFDWK